MGKRNSNRREQTQKDTAVSRVRAVQELRRSNAAQPIPSSKRYNRSTVRNAAQRGIYLED